MFSLRFAFKNVVSRKSSLVIILFISFSIGILVMANAVFDGTGHGIEKVFSSSFTGDVVIRAKTDFPMSLFGDETPVTGELSELPRIVPFKNVSEYIESIPAVEKSCPQLTGRAVLKVNGVSQMATVFGVDAVPYCDIMSGITVVDGRPYEEGEKCVMISETLKAELENESGEEILVGDTVQLMSGSSSSFSLRSAVVSGIYRYEIPNDIQNSILLCEPELVRSLLGIESLLSSVEIDRSESVMIDEFDNIEDLFAEEDVFCGNGSSDLQNQNHSGQLSGGTIQNEEDSESLKTTWNYIICKLHAGERPEKVVRAANRFFAHNELHAVAMDWKAAAGSSAQYVYWMRLIVNIGLLLLIGTGFIVVNNTLVIAAMDRTKETGALRAIGAGRNFIALEYLFETLLLTVTAGVVGCVFGVAGNCILSGAHIQFSNPYLIQLFGGTELMPSVTAGNLLFGMMLSVLFAFIAWIYPVHIALETSPVAAMEHI